MHIIIEVLLIVTGYFLFEQVAKRIHRFYDTDLNTKTAKRLYRYIEENKVPVRNQRLGKALYYFFDVNTVINHLLDKIEGGE